MSNVCKNCTSSAPKPLRAGSWEADCLQWRKRVLTGKHAHWCHDWDGLPVDETTPEWDACTCFEEANDDRR